MTKDLQEKAINIKGKQYVQVSDRIIYFNDTYPNGMIQTELVSSPESKMVVVKAIVTPDFGMMARNFTGYSQATWGDGMVNKSAALENAETSAVGRALAMMGIGVIDSVASVDEIHKAKIVDRGDGFTREQNEMAEAVTVGTQPGLVNSLTCPLHNKPLRERPNGTFDHRQQINGVWNMCNGSGFVPQSN